MIEQVIQQIVESLEPSHGDNLLGFRMDARHYLELSPAFKNASIAFTDDSECMFVIMAEVSEQPKSLAAVGASLDKLWRTLAYHTFEASSCLWYKEAMILRGVTILGESWFVTGKMIISGERYEELRGKHEEDMRELPSLPSH